MAMRNFTDEQLDSWIAENAKLEPEGIATYWCKGCKHLVATNTHKTISKMPLWKILLRLDGHSLPHTGKRRRELMTQYKEAAKRLEHQTNIQTRLVIWNREEALRIVRWDGKEKKWVVEKKKKEPPKTIKENVVKKKVVVKKIRGKRRKRCKGCNKLFSPKVGNQKYCTPDCGNRTRLRAFYSKRKN